MSRYLRINNNSSDCSWGKEVHLLPAQGVECMNSSMNSHSDKPKAHWLIIVQLQEITVLLFHTQGAPLLYWVTSLFPRAKSQAPGGRGGVWNRCFQLGMFHKLLGTLHYQLNGIMCKNWFSQWLATHYFRHFPCSLHGFLKFWSLLDFLGIR